MLQLIKRIFAPIDMTKGSPVKQVLKFAIPMLLGNFAQQLYSTVDSVIVGRFVGDNALAAVGSAMPILNLMLVLFIGISTGASIMVSQYFGARKREELSRSIGSCISLTAIASFIIMIIGPLSAGPMLRLLNTPDSIIDWCRWYLIIIYLGFAGTGYYNILGGVLRGLGDSVSALLYLIIATILNMVLDYVFVAHFGLGVPGVALATIIAQIISAILTFRKLAQMRDVFDMKAEYMKPEWKFSRELIRLGLPSGVTQAVISMSMVVVQSLTNTFGEMCIAANVIVMRVDGFVMLPALSFGVSMTTFAGQNIGAKRMDRVESGTRSITLSAMGVSAMLSLGIFIIGKPLMGIFTDTEELVDMAYHIMCILLAGYVAMEVIQCLSGVMRGAGDTITPMWTSLVISVGLRVPLAYLLVHLTKTEENPQGNFYMMGTSLLIAWICGALLTYAMYKRGRWKGKALT